MRVLLAGGSGLIGGALRAELAAGGDEVRLLTRRPADSPGQWTWTGQVGSCPPEAVDWADAVVSLNGAPLARWPWTAAYKLAIMDSRVDSASAIAAAIVACGRPPEVWLSASACGFYGSDHPADDAVRRPFDETAPSGGGFLAAVVRAWEAATAPAWERTRVVRARTGLVLGPPARGGLTRPLALAGRFGLAPRFGDGRQHWPWISLRDEARALAFALRQADLTGPVNLAGPTPATADEVIAALAAAIGRPAWLRLPAALLRAALGETAQELILASQPAIPAALVKAGFEFLDPTPAAALASALRA
jgi:uncharacterized protein (TIGR01777 family)